MERASKRGGGATMTRRKFPHWDIGWTEGLQNRLAIGDGTGEVA